MTFDDERVRFYLRHRARIEEWAALRADAAAAVHAWLVGLLPDVERLAAELGPDVGVRAWVTDDFEWPRIGLLRSTWPMREGESAAMVTLEWQRRRVVLHGGDSPYVGLRCSKDDPIGAALRQSDAVRKVRTSRKDAASPGWVGYGFVEPPADFPASEAEYRVLLVRALRGAWEVYAPRVDEAVREVAAAR